MASHNHVLGSLNFWTHIKWLLCNGKEKKLNSELNISSFTSKQPIVVIFFLIKLELIY